MVVSTLSSKKKLLNNILRHYPDISIEEGSVFYWQPKENKIYTGFKKYAPKEYWLFIHEIGHALLSHKKFSSDFELLQYEIDAWDKAREIAKVVDIKIDETYIQDCLDEYRDWLHQRSLCPTCRLTGIQTNITTYQCLNCSGKWRVGKEHMRRHYRKKSNSL